MRRCYGCGHAATRRTERGNLPPYRKPGQPTMEEQMEPARLVDLVTRRPDLVGLPMLGARLAAGTTEGC